VGPQATGPVAVDVVVVDQFAGVVVVAKRAVLAGPVQLHEQRRWDCRATGDEPARETGDVDGLTRIWGIFWGFTVNFKLFFK
jgi:hypothetical protein